MSTQTLSEGQPVDVHIFKVHGQLYRRWIGAKVLENNDQHLIVNLDKAKVFEDNGKRWSFERTSFCIFPKKNYFNVVIRFENSSCKAIYCNLASPVFFQDNYIGFFDYDIDLKWNFSDKLQIVDWNDFTKNIKANHYSRELIDQIYRELEWLEFLFRHNKYIFNSDQMERLFTFFKTKSLF